MQQVSDKLTIYAKVLRFQLVKNDYSPEKILEISQQAKNKIHFSTKLHIPLYTSTNPQPRFVLYVYNQLCRPPLIFLNLLDDISLTLYHIIKAEEKRKWCNRILSVELTLLQDIAWFSTYKSLRTQKLIHKSKSIAKCQSNILKEQPLSKFKLNNTMLRKTLKTSVNIQYKSVYLRLKHDTPSF